MVRITRIVWLEYIRAFRVFLVVDWDEWNQLRDNLIRIKPDGRITQHPNPFEDQTWLWLETQMDRRELDELIARDQWNQLRDNLIRIKPDGRITQHPNPFEDQTWLLLEIQMDRRELDELIAIYNSWDPLEKELDLIMGVGQ